MDWQNIILSRLTIALPVQLPHRLVSVNSNALSYSAMLWRLIFFLLRMGDTGFEPVTSSV
jgi:hypothetical protein